jgi:sarcosine oxidase subunit gamma
MPEPAVSVRIRDDLRMAAVLALRDRAPAVIARAAALYGLALRDGPFRDTAAGMEALGIGRRRWLFVRPQSEAGLPADIALAFADLAAVSDQSDGYVVFEVAGPDARTTLARGVAVDFHARVFSCSDVAVTNLFRINVVLWQCDARPERFCVAVPRSYHESFREFLPFADPVAADRHAT